MGLVGNVLLVRVARFFMLVCSSALLFELEARLPGFPTAKVIHFDDISKGFFIFNITLT